MRIYFIVLIFIFGCTKDIRIKPVNVKAEPIVNFRIGKGSYYFKKDIASGALYKGNLKCPLGHQNLYSLPVIPECIINEADPKEYVVCLVCFYYYHQRHLYWEYDSCDPYSFAIPLNDFSKRFLDIKYNSPYSTFYHEYKFNAIQKETLQMGLDIEYSEANNFVVNALKDMKYEVDKNLSKYDVVVTKRSKYLGNWKEYKFEIGIVEIPSQRDQAKCYMTVYLTNKSIWEH